MGFVVEEKEMWTVILNDTDIEFVSDKPISKMVDHTYDIFVPEANVHVASELTE